MIDPNDLPKHVKKIRRILLSLGILFVSAILAIVPACAQNTTRVAPQQQPTDCSNSTLTTKQFLDMLHTIATHGDLTDIPFIEQTLGIKFAVSYSDNEDAKGQPYRRMTYQSTSLFGAPMTIILSFNADTDNQPKGYRNIYLSFDIRHHDYCLKIIPSEVFDRFGGDFEEGHGTDGSIKVTELKELEENGKNGSRVFVGYSYDHPENIVNHFGINERQ